MKSLILIIFILNINVIFGQTKKIHIIEVSSIKYYYVYKAVEYEKNPSDTLILLGNKANNDEHKIIALQKKKNMK